MAEEEGKVNIMSVEFAIEREVAYREKAANLMPPSKMNSLKHFSTLQVPSSSHLAIRPRPQGPQPSRSSSSEIPSLTTSNISLPRPHQLLIPGPTPASNLLNPGQSLIMNPSQMRRQMLYRTTTKPRHFELKRKATSSLHRQPPPLPVSQQPRPLPQHPRPLDQPPRPLPQQPRPLPPHQNGIISVDQHGIFFCKVCQVPCTGSDCLKSHLKGQKHKAKMQLLQMAGNSAIPRGQQIPQCELCGISCSDQSGLEMHFKGQKHKAKVEEMKSGSKNGEEKTSNRPWCELCQIWCMNEDALQQHLKGQKHIARLYSTQGNARPASGNL